MNFILLCVAPPLLKAQITPPISPVIDRVSVDTATGRVLIEWIGSISPDVEKYTFYYMYTDQIGNTYPKTTGEETDGEVRQYIYTHPDVIPSQRKQSLTLAAIDSAGTPSPYSEPAHTSMHLSVIYDSCTKSMALNWNSYAGWNDLTKYEVYVSIGGSPYEILEPMGTQDSSEIHSGIEDNFFYCYFVKAIRAGGKPSFSNIACRNVSHPLHPAWINAESASAVGADEVEVKFAIDPAAGVTSYQLYKADGPGKPFKEDEIFRDVRDSLSYLDPVVSTKKKYRYKLYSLDVCDNPKMESESNICGNLVLKAWSVGLEGFLAWNSYLEYEAGVKNYLIYRDINRQGPSLIYGVSSSDTSYRDDLSFVSGSDIEDEICYLIEAEENDSYIRGNKGFSKSNIACISVVPEIQMANAFTPNGDGINEEIKPELTFIPHQFVFQVFDRWGSRIFQSEDSETGWDGRVNGGSMVPEGVYVYYIKLTTSSGIEVEKKGEITVIFP